MRRSACLILLAAGAVLGCGELDDALEPAPPRTVVPFEVWNRTTEPVFLVNRSGQRIDVPACGPASAAQFDMSYVDVRTERGYWYKFASPGPPADAPRTQYLVLVAGGETLPGTTYDRPGPLPGCDGRPDVQPGV